MFRHSTVASLRCAHDLHEAVRALDSDDPVQLRVGVSAGEAAEEDGDWFGMAVIEASRLCAFAEPSRTVTTVVVRSLVGSRGGHQFAPLGSKNLKGIPTPVDVWMVTDSSGLASGSSTGPMRRRVKWAAAGAAVVVALLAAVVAVATRDDDASTLPTGGASTTLGPGSTVTQTAAPTTDATAASSGDDRATIVAPSGYKPKLENRDCAADADAKDAIGVECWTLTVPEDRANPQRTIDLHGYRIPAASDPDNAPTVIALGPTTRFDNPLAEVANIVMVPSRGFELSSPPFDCPDTTQVREASLTVPSNDPTIAAQLLDALRSCRERLVTDGVRLSSYNFEAEISDVTDYMTAAGVSEAVITALSQDAPAALVAADRFPGTFRGVFLQNPVDPGSSWRADPASDLAGAFNRTPHCALPIFSAPHTFPTCRANNKLSTSNSRRHRDSSRTCRTLNSTRASTPRAPTSPSTCWSMVIDLPGRCM